VDSGKNARGDHVFNSEAAVIDFLMAEKVPNAGYFWGGRLLLGSLQRGGEHVSKMTVW
jgi:hypothetical protein